MRKDMENMHTTNLAKLRGGKRALLKISTKHVEDKERAIEDPNESMLWGILN